MSRRAGAPSEYRSATAPASSRSPSASQSARRASCSPLRDGWCVPPATPSARPWRRSSPSAHQRRREALQRPSSSPPSQHIRGQFPKLLKSLIQNATGFSAHRLRPLHNHRPDFLPVQPIDQRKQLRMVQPYRGRPNPGPAELRFLKRFGEQTYPCAIKPNRLDPVRSFRTEYVERAIERISAAVPHQGHQAGRTLTEVNRCARHINLHASRDHALRTARITSASRSGSTSPPARTTTSPTTISTMSLRIASKRANLTGLLGAPTNGATTPEAFALRRHAKSCDGSTPFDRAIADPFAPATNVSPTILAFSSSDHDR